MKRFFTWLGYSLFTMVSLNGAYILGLGVQNLLLPSGATAAAGWLLYFLPLGLVLAFVLAWLIYFFTLYEMKSTQPRYFKITGVVLALIVSALVSWHYYWVASVAFFLALLMAYKLCRRLICRNQKRAG